MKRNIPPLRIAPLFLTLAAWLCAPHIAKSFYNPTTGCWLNRDPSSERGGLNLYAFVGNDAQQRVDGSGLDIYSGITIEIPPGTPGWQPPGWDPATRGDTLPLASDGEPTNAECSQFPWWNKVVGVTFGFGGGCKSHLTSDGKKMPQFLQACVLRHEGVHAKLCKVSSFCYSITTLFKRGRACNEYTAYAESVKCAKESMPNIASMSPTDQLALRCYLATSRQSCKANKVACEKNRKAVPGAPRCD